MSLFDDASLIVTPNAYKAGKLYSIKPDTGAGDLDVVRATGATRVNENGLIELVGNNVPRIDYPPLGGCPSILVEPQRTNLVSNSTFANNNTGFTKITGQLSPDGLNNASLLTEVALNNQKLVNSLLVSISGNTTYAYSVFLKYNGIQNITINATDGISGFSRTFDILNGVIVGTSTNAFIIPYPDGWYRCVVVRTTGASATSGFIQINFGTYLGDGVKGFYWFGAQVEASSNATSYIPTTSATVTRNADVISKSGVSSLINSQEGCLFVDFVDMNISDNQFKEFSLSDGTVNNIIRLGYVANTGATFTISCNVIVSNSTQFTFSQTFTKGVRNKLLLRYKQSEFSIFRNGQLLTQQNSGNIFGANVLSQFHYSRNNASAFFVGNVNSNLLLPYLTDTQAIQLTTL